MAILAFNPRFRLPTAWCRREPTLAEILSDPIVVALMKADRVDRKALEAQFQSLARARSGDKCQGAMPPGMACHSE
jgi:hypothetical protein